MLFCLLILENKKIELVFEVTFLFFQSLTKKQGNESIPIQTRGCDKILVTTPFFRINGVNMC
ncbi:hypothetical protein C0649_05305 [Enterococcus faecium]|nr:hypothetical protein EA467_00495 [Enterococcus faecium]MSS54540.1 hypothetical protein [Enterococcus sp. WCA-130-P53-23F]MSS66769.1 hypothetical protein [Enterococcus sp. BSM-130-P53-22D]HAW88940.1 hypothetical protein [Enterococcus sp.]EGP5093548.1 hypothetical protein [Enterococcus faecium]